MTKRAMSLTTRSSSASLEGDVVGGHMALERQPQPYKSLHARQSCYKPCSKANNEHMGTLGLSRDFCLRHLALKGNCLVLFQEKKEFFWTLSLGRKIYILFV